MSKKKSNEIKNVSIKEYTKNDKKRLITRINKIDDKKIHKDIKKIIEKSNPELDSTKNSNGLFIYFNSLENITYTKIEEYLDKYDKTHLNEYKEDTSEDLSDSITVNTKKTIKKLKLTNAEQHILNKIKYENEMNNSINDNSESDIFIKKQISKK
jgi:hypothetical protein